MTLKKIKKIIISLPQGRVEWFLVPWDSEIMKFPVGQISQFELFDGCDIGEMAEALQRLFLDAGVNLVNVRLPLNLLRESMALEMAGFRFIEVTYRPLYTNLSSWRTVGVERDIEVVSVKRNELSVVKGIAKCAFNNERYNVDPRLQAKLGNRRYAYWVETAYEHPNQSLYALQAHNEIIGFFVTEALSREHIYWHLTAIAPAHQGKGYGFSAWQKMMLFHQQAGFRKISTTIVARNLAVVNLYSKLGFSFTKPEMGFHWLAEDIC